MNVLLSIKQSGANLLISEIKYLLNFCYRSRVVRRKTPEEKLKQDGFSGGRKPPLWHRSIFASLDLLLKYRL